VADDDFGATVDINNEGSLLAISDSFNDMGTGKINFYIREGDNWILQDEMLIGETSNEFLGTSIDFNASGEILSVGGKGDLDFVGYARAYGNEEILNTSQVDSSRIELYPNPNNGQFTVTIGNQEPPSCYSGKCTWAAS